MSRNYCIWSMLIMMLMIIHMQTYPIDNSKGEGCSNGPINNSKGEERSNTHIDPLTTVMEEGKGTRINPLNDSVISEQMALRWTH
jgi:hypothetical protein